MFRLSERKKREKDCPLPCGKKHTQVYFGLNEKVGKTIFYSWWDSLEYVSHRDGVELEVKLGSVWLRF